MKRINKTDKNLQQVWGNLDTACGSLDNAFITLSQMVNVPKEIMQGMETIDMSAIVVLKNKIEKLQQEKKK